MLNDPFLKVGLSGNAVLVKTRAGEVILRSEAENPLKAIQKLRKMLDAMEHEQRHPDKEAAE